MYFTFFGAVKVFVQGSGFNIILVFSSVIQVSFYATNPTSSYLVHSKLIYTVLKSGVTHHPVNCIDLNRTLLCLPFTQSL